MAIRPSSSSITLQLSPRVAYTAPKTAAAIVRKVTACNTGADARAVTVHLAPAGGSIGLDNTVVSARTVGAGETVDLELADHSLEAGGSVVAFADQGNVVSLRVSTLEVPL